MAQLYNITLYLSYKSVQYDFREKKKKPKQNFSENWMNCHFRAIFQSYYIIVNWRNASKEVKTEKRDQLICQRKQKERKKSNKTNKKSSYILWETSFKRNPHFVFFYGRWKIEWNKYSKTMAFSGQTKLLQNMTYKSTYAVYLVSMKQQYLYRRMQNFHVCFNFHASQSPRRSQWLSS